MEDKIGFTHKCKLCGEEIQNGLVNWANHLDTCKGNQPVVVKYPATIEDFKALIAEFEKDRSKNTDITPLNPRPDNFTIPDEWLAELLKDNPDAMRLIHTKNIINKTDSE